MRSFSSLDPLKILSHPTRLAILRRLMRRPATLSQLGAQLGETPAHIRHHLQRLQSARLIEPSPDHPQQNHLEKYYQATADAFLVNVAVLPSSPAGDAELVIGSQDAAAHSLVEDFNRRLHGRSSPGLALQVLPSNSLDGLVHLRQGVCQMTTCHLIDPETGIYNRPYVRRIFPGQPMAVIHLYRREEGLMVPPGNPDGVRGLEDLARPELTMVNRERGSGIRIWLDQALKRLGIPPAHLRGYQNEVLSHVEVARMVWQGQARVGLGIAARARQYGLGFVPLFDEPYELVVSQAFLADPQYAPFFDHLTSGEFRASVRRLDGYSVPASAGQVDAVMD